MKSAGYISLGMILCGVLLPGKLVLGMVPIALVLLLSLDAGALRQLSGRKLWLWLGTGALLMPLMGGGSQVRILGLGYSLDTLIIALCIAARGFLILSAMILVRRHIPPQSLTKILMKAGFGRNAALIPLALHLVPLMMETGRRTYMIWKLRGGWRRNIPKNLLTLLTGLQVQWVREAEELALALAVANRERRNPEDGVEERQ